MSETRTALILGASGGIGGETARALAARGWRIRALHRDPARVAADSRFDWRRGDAMSAADVIAAAAGVQAIVHAVNPPGYRNWQALVLPMMANTIAAARASGARILLPGTVYNFGAVSGLIAEDAPQAAETRKGRIRIALERALEESGLPVLILRAGDFFGPASRNSWFGQGIVMPGRPLARVTYPGAPDVGHAWAYLPDVAETFARLLDREAELPRFARFHFGGHWFERGIDIAHVVREAAGRPELPIRTFPWAVVGLARPFVPLFRELWEMRYLWQIPLRLDNRRLRDFLGTEPHTPAFEAARASLAGLGCLEMDGKGAVPA
ncbi:NAD(P)H-binding protein [Zavarzinia sp.]|uniref:NAD(P)H-binding protein n=1 Tax=Zavarzinia sp. TaxID=2027920 RepID=UPI0035662D7A